jgi:hypothetical protein
MADPELSAPIVNEGVKPDGFQRLAAMFPRPFGYRVGNRDDLPWQVLSAQSDGSFLVSVAAQQRVTLQLSESVTSGWLEVNGERVSLPVGSTLVAEEGRFYWLPPAGFLGRTTLVFPRAVQTNLPPIRVHIDLLADAKR